MSVKGKNNLIAAIELGPHALNMKIVEIGKNMDVKILENLRHPITLGQDTFATGKVSFETLTETCEILKGFNKLMADYKVKEYRAIATVAVREASNREYIVDQIRLKTGIKIEVIENSIERHYSFNAVKERLQNFEELRREGCIVADIGSGSIQVSILSSGNLEESLNIKMGALRIMKMLSVLEGRTLNFPKVMEEFITGKIDTVNFFRYQKSFKNIVLIGGDVRIINKLLLAARSDESRGYILKESFEKLYNEFLYKTDQYMKTELDLPQVSAEILLPTMMIFKKILEITKADKFYTPLVSPLDGLISGMCKTSLGFGGTAEDDKDIISQARSIAKRYQYDEAHSRDVEKKSLFLFDEMCKLHGLEKKERLLLQLAAILHDCGKFISLNSHYIHSYDIISASEILGISSRELEIIANIARYHSTMVPEQSHPNFSKLDEQSKLITAKLTAIIRIADSLDRSHKQKIYEIKVSLDKDRLVIKAGTLEDALLEQWTFEDKAEFFKMVFGVVPELKTKKEVLHAW
ncbi:MAG: HD domain-containing protein [Clostridiaceae bacterium]